VFRNVNHPPFDWRKAKFQSMEIGTATIHPERKRSTDPALIAEVVRTLSDGVPTTAELPADISSKNIAELQMESDEIQGLYFCPHVYVEKSGTVYLATSMGSEFTQHTVKFHAGWITAGPRFTSWMNTR
jgi:hypothetical protein